MTAKTKVSNKKQRGRDKKTDDPKKADEPDPVIADLLRKVERGDVAAQFDLGTRYFAGKGLRKNFREAVRYLRLAAAQGHDGAHHYLGRCYEDGLGVEENQEIAGCYYKLASDKCLGKLAPGQEKAIEQFMVGLHHEEGNGVDKDLKEAARYYRLAADQGYADAQDSLGALLLAENPAEATRFFTLAADQGHLEAQYHLGLCYECGTQKDLDKAAHYYKQAADRGFADAQHCLGNLLVEKNPQDAVRYYEMAANQGHIQARYDVGLCYVNGIGVDKDHGEAVLWFQPAADEGHAGAQFIERRKTIDPVFGGGGE